jgi:hypothetical protein
MEERRKVPRYLADVSAELSNPLGDSGSKVVVEVLSVQGGCVRGASLPESGHKCRLSLDWQGSQIQADAEVAWKSSRGLAGLRFLALDPKSNENLRELLATLRMQPIPPLKPEED